MQTQTTDRLDPRTPKRMTHVRATVVAKGEIGEAELLRTSDRDYVWIFNGEALACGHDLTHSHQHIAVRRLHRCFDVIDQTKLAERLAG